jgi:hypothetical protein
MAHIPNDTTIISVWQPRTYEEVCKEEMRKMIAHISYVNIGDGSNADKIQLLVEIRALIDNKIKTLSK